MLHSKVIFKMMRGPNDTCQIYLWEWLSPLKFLYHCNRKRRQRDTDENSAKTTGERKSYPHQGMNFNSNNAAFPNRYK